MQVNMIRLEWMDELVSVGDIMRETTTMIRRKYHKWITLLENKDRVTLPPAPQCHLAMYTWGSYAIRTIDARLCDFSNVRKNL